MSLFNSVQSQNEQWAELAKSSPMIQQREAALRTGPALPPITASSASGVGLGMGSQQKPTTQPYTQPSMPFMGSNPRYHDDGRLLSYSIPTFGRQPESRAQEFMRKNFVPAGTGPKPSGPFLGSFTNRPDLMGSATQNGMPRWKRWVADRPLASGFENSEPIYQEKTRFSM